MVVPDGESVLKPDPQRYGVAREDRSQGYEINRWRDAVSNWNPISTAPKDQVIVVITAARFIGWRQALVKWTQWHGHLTGWGVVPEYPREAWQTLSWEPEYWFALPAKTDWDQP